MPRESFSCPTPDSDRNKKFLRQRIQLVKPRSARGKGIARMENRILLAHYSGLRLRDAASLTLDVNFDLHQIRYFPRKSNCRQSRRPECKSGASEVVSLGNATPKQRIVLEFVLESRRQTQRT